jgi:hypothetical protein
MLVHAFTSNYVLRVKYETENDVTIQLNLDAKAKINKAIEFNNH